MDSNHRNTNKIGDNMNANEVTTDMVVVDNDGTVWIHGADINSWRYLVSKAEGYDIDTELSWDNHPQISPEYGPYIQLDFAASQAIRSFVNALVAASHA